MRRLKILYLMHVDWKWIKQRPHFLAEGIAKTHDVLVIYRPHPNRRILLKNRSSIRRLPFLAIPRRWGAIFIRMDCFINRLWILFLKLFFRPDIIWITFPTLHSYLTKGGSEKLIYDCMDDVQEFYEDEKIRAEIAAVERALIERAAIVLCSSLHLRKVVEKRYGFSERYRLVRNGIQKELISEATINEEDDRRKDMFFDIAYIGTISSWIDYESLIYCLDGHENLRFHLVGFADHGYVRHDRLIYHGTVEHAKLPEYAKRFNAFIMPFVISPLIEGVDPIKLYEYLTFGKEVISVYYPEIARFGRFINFYNTKEELNEIINMMIEGKLKKRMLDDGVRQFLEENAWDKRVGDINQIVGSIVD